MKNLEIISDIFNKTKEIMGPVVINMENPQMSHILYYLSLTACYLKSKEEAEVFKNYWNNIKEKIKSGADQMDYLNQAHMLEAHIEQALKEESVHNPKSLENIGIAPFYENKFPHLFQEAKKEYELFKKDPAKGLREHYEDIFSSQEKWEDALRRGDPAAFCD